MKTTNEVIDAVVDGSPCTEEELRYAVRNLSIWQNQAVLPIARAVTEDPLTARTKRDLDRLFKSAQEGNRVALDVRLKGGSFEPGVPKEERLDRFAKHTANTAVKLATALSAAPSGKEQG